MKKRIFDLAPGDKFIFPDKPFLAGLTFTVRKFKRERRPRIGVVLHCYTWEEPTGKIAAFITNYEVETVDDAKT